MYKILIADDESEIREGLSTYFPWNDLGFEVAAHVENGRKALAYLLEHPVDVLLCDIVMPQMSGLEVAETLAGLNSQVCVVFLSGYRDFDYAQKALELGVRNYVVKSAKTDALATVFRKIREELDARHLPSPVKGLAAPTDAVSQTQKIISLVRRYVEENFATASLNQAAECVHMNPFYLSRYFKQHTGQNFSDLVTEIRMHKAIELFEQHNLKTYEVSEAVGYTSSTNFARTFKSFFGRSPRAFRKGEST